MKTNILALFIMVGVVVGSIPVYAQDFSEVRADCNGNLLDATIGWKRGYMEGYTQSPSVAQGDSVEFKVSTLEAFVPPDSATVESCAMRIYRIAGYSRYHTGDVPVDSAIFQATFYPLKDSAHTAIWPGQTDRYPYDYRRGCEWETAVKRSTFGWQSGVYYAKLYLPGQEADTTKVGYIPFVVRPSGQTQSRILCVIAWNTYQAYNYWGGGSLYYWVGKFDSPDTIWTNQGVEKAIHTVSFRRPFVHFFSPTANVMFTTQMGQVDHIERRFIAWAESSGYAIDYCVDADVNKNENNFLGQYKFVVTPGHSEYWARFQRRNIDDQQIGFKSTGGHLAFLASNNCYWKVDYKPVDNPPTNNPDSMFCNKNHGQYWWRSQIDSITGKSMDEARFIGVEYMSNNDPTADSADSVKQPDHWLLRGLGLGYGSRLGLGNETGEFYTNVQPLAGGESDMKVDTVSPPTTVILASRYVRQPGSCEPHLGLNPLYSHLTYYEDTLTNSRVFAAGGMGWSDCLFGQDAGTIRAITARMFDHFTGRKYIGNVYSQPNTPLIWQGNVELDGNVNILQGKDVSVLSSSTVTIDSTLSVNGTLEINGNVTLAGPGNINVGSTGHIVLASGATLTLRTAVFMADSVGITVPTGTTLRVDTLARMYLGSGSQIFVLGALSVVGTSANPVTFTRNGSADFWPGIILNATNTGATATFSHCKILHAQVGISANEMQPTIQYTTIDSGKIGISLYQCAGEVSHCAITNNIIKGVIIDGEYGYIDPPASPELTDDTISYNETGLYITKSEPILERNQIAGNSEYGVYCDDGGNPFISRNEQDSPGNNVFDDNGGANLLADNSSSPFLGFQEDEFSAPYGGNNSFGPKSHEYDISANKYSGVWARANYWSEYPPEEKTSFYTDGEAWIDWEFPLDSYHSRPFSGIANKGTVLKSSPRARIGVPDDMLQAAMAHRSRKHFCQAINLLKQYAAQSPAPPFAPVALVMAEQFVADSAKAARNSTVTTAFAAYMDSLLSVTPSEGVKRTLLGLRKNGLCRRGKWAEAIEAAETISVRYPNSVMDEHALYTSFNASLFGLADRQKAQSVLGRMRQRFPESHLTAMAALLMSTAPRNTTASPSAPKIAGNGARQEILPQLFALHQNYPNPFNPSTTIKFELPEAAFVSLVVYDVLGRRVTDLASGVHSAGYHAAQWNAASVASGVYFVRFTASDARGSVRMNKVNKLILMK